MCRCVLRFFPVNSAVTGKAVQTGHSSAAVTHHRPPFRFRAEAEPVSGLPGAKAGARRAKRASNNGEVASDKIPGGASR